MKKSIFTIIIFILTGCASMNFDGPENYGKVIEYSILWKGHTNKLWPPVEMEKMLDDHDYFEKKGNFYKAKKQIYVFGHELEYVGIMGMNFMRGPNAHLFGKAPDVAKIITENYGIEFVKNKSSYIADIKENLFISIYEPKPGYTSIAGGSIVEQYNKYLSH